MTKKINLAETEALMFDHQGRNVKRERIKKKIKQSALAKELTVRLGEPWTQKRVSTLEMQAEIDDKVLESVAEALDVDADDLRSRPEDEKGVTIFGNHFEGESSAFAQYYKCTFNPIDEIKRLNDELANEKNERIALLEKILNEKK